MRPTWSTSRVWLGVIALATVLIAGCTGLLGSTSPTAATPTIATPQPPTLAGFSGPPRSVGQPIVLGSLTVTVRRVISLDAGAGYRYVGVELVIQPAPGGTLVGAKLPGTALIDSSLHVYAVDAAATSAALTAAQATPEATPSPEVVAATAGTPAPGTPTTPQSARAVVGFRVPTSASGLELAIDGRASGGTQVLVKL
ncbi:MAG TPA: hypothetical protein VFN57_10380 [Thermomicrobiaceae bacterium]|nr:hypothetical protein [Thermomicrobiaceae bacterium]